MQSRDVLVLASLLLACGGATGGPKDVSRSDTDDIGCFQEFGKDAPGDIAAAVAARADEVTGCLGDSGSDDADAFRFDVEEDDMRDALHHFEVEPANTLSLCVSLVGAGDAELQRTCSQTPGENIDMWAVGTTGKPMKLKLEPARALQNTESYTVRSSHEIIDDPDEPNEYQEDATPLTLGESHQAYFVASSGGAPVELDLYRVDVEDKGLLKFEITNPPSEIAFMVEVLDASGKRLKRIVSKDKGATISEGVELEAGGVYILRLSNALGKVVPRNAGQNGLPSYLSQKYSVTASWEP